MIERVQALAEGPGGDDLAVIALRRIDVVVVISARAPEPLRVELGELAERHAGFKPQRLDTFHHGQNRVESRSFGFFQAAPMQ